MRRSATIRSVHYPLPFSMRGPNSAASWVKRQVLIGLAEGCRPEANKAVEPVGNDRDREQKRHKDGRFQPKMLHLRSERAPRFSVCGAGLLKRMVIVHGVGPALKQAGVQAPLSRRRPDKRSQRSRIYGYEVGRLQGNCQIHSPGCCQSNANLS